MIKWLRSIKQLRGDSLECLVLGMKKMQVGWMIHIFYASSPMIDVWAREVGIGQIWSNLIKLGHFGVYIKIITIKWSNNIEIFNSCEAIDYNVYF